MKSYKKLSAVSLIGILFVSSIATAMPANAGQVLKRVVKKEAQAVEVLPMTYAQVGTDAEGLDCLRFATPVDLSSAKNLTYTRTMAGREANVAEVKTAYKGIVSNGGVYYYDGNEVTDVPNDNDYYWANYMVKFSSESTNKGAMLTVELDVDGNKAPFLTTSYNAVAQEGPVATFKDENGTLVGRSIVESGNTPVYAGEALQEGQCWTDGVEYYDELPTIVEDTIFEIAEKIHEHTEEIVKGKAATCTENGLTDGKICSECNEVLLKQEPIIATGHTGGTATETSFAVCTNCGLSYGELVPTYLGTVGDLKAYGTIQNNTLKMTYTTTNTSEYEVSQFLTFGDGVVYEIRFKSGWIGIYNWNSGSWVDWNGKVANPVYIDANNSRTITQTTDLSFFSDFGVNITNPRLLLAKNISDAYLVYKDTQVLSYNNKASWLAIDNENHTFTGQTQSYLGTVADFKAYGSIENNVLNMTYTTSNLNNFQISQFITFGDGVVYEIRFLQGWVGVYNWNSQSFLSWNDKVGNPIYNTINNNRIITQTTDLRFFSDLGIDISNPLLLVAKEIDQAYLSYNDTFASSRNDLSTWLNVNNENNTFTLPEYQYMGTLISSFDNSNIEAYYLIAGHQLVTKYVVEEGKQYRLKQDLYFGGTITYSVIQESAGFTGIWNVNDNTWFAYGPKIAVATTHTENGYTTYSQIMDLTYFKDQGEPNITNPKFIVTNNIGVEINYKGQGTLNYNDKSTWISLR